jgi:hypothetical protein
VRVAELDAEHHLRLEACHKLRQRGVGAEDMPEVDQQSGGRVVGGSDQLGALRHRADEAEGEWFQRNSRPDASGLLSDPAERLDERRDVVHR